MPDARGDANDSLRQLFETGAVQDEWPFVVQGVTLEEVMLEVDSNIKGEEALKAGENIFSYWTYSNGKGIRIGENERILPVLSAPMFRGRDGATFGEGKYVSGAFGGQGVVTFSDGAAYVYSLDEEGKLVDHSVHGDPGPHMEHDDRDFLGLKVHYPTGCLSKEEVAKAAHTGLR